MLNSMTGFGSAEGASDEMRWRWDAKSVNGRGLEVRMRTPSGMDAHELRWRQSVAGRFKRGSITLSLSVELTAGAQVAQLNEAQLAAAALAADKAAQALRATGLEPAPVAPERLLSLRGVFELDAAGVETADDSQVEAFTLTLGAALDALADGRREEGARILATLTEIVDEIARLTAQAEANAAVRADAARSRLQQRVAAVMEAGAELDEARLAQELALIAVKIDVSEEIERLKGHVVAARGLLEAGEPVGRKLDFLAQEFNREANTLCSKSQDPDLTEVGLSLKVVIDQLREQAANVE
ncbi:MAG: YicC/YloC family endoribonuclease [Pseudomonadota bacterium]